MTQEFSEGHGIEDAVWGHAAFTCYFDAPVHMVQLPDGVRVGIDAEDAAVIERLLVPAPVEVEPPRMRVDFYRDVFRAGFQDFVDVDLISRTERRVS